MRILLDTHILLWWLADSPKLPDEVGQVIVDPETEVLVSAASAWEIAIKSKLGKLRAPGDLSEQIKRVGFDEVAITIDDALATASLPDHHRDPFDRMLVVQTSRTGSVLVTVDPLFERYSVPRLLP